MFSYLQNSQAPWQISLLFIFAAIVMLFQPVSITLVKIGYEKTHKFIQLFLTVILIPIFSCFEYYVRMYNWRDIAEESVYYDSVIIPLLPIHMLFAGAALLCWFFTIYEMLKHQNQTAYRPNHKRLGYASSALMYLTALSGACLYHFAFSPSVTLP